MHRWIRDWLRAWRSERVEFQSPASVEEVRERLSAGATSYRQLFLRYGTSSSRLVVGRTGPRRISLTALSAGERNIWNLSVRGRLQPATSGSRLVGKLGWSPFVKAFTAVSLGVPLVVLILLAGAAWTGAPSAPPVAFCLVPLGFIVFALVLSSWGIRVARKDEDYLRDWLAERLRTAGSGIRGYQPWQGTPM